MIFRARVDIAWSGLGRAVMACLFPGRASGHARAIYDGYPRDENPLACLSARSGFDLLLETLALPAGSEVLLSAITIPDMARIVRAHGLVPVPVDVHPDTLAPDAASLDEALSARSKVLVVAHLFGAVSDFDPARSFARQHGLLFVEDCAQSYLPGRFRGNVESDVRMLSFGPIKTNTAIGGGLLFVRDRELHQRMASRQAARPAQPRRDYLRRVMKYAFLQCLASSRILFASFRATCRVLGRDFDDVLRQAARGFPGADFFERIRQRPSAPLLRILASHVQRGNPRVHARAAAGHALAAMLPPQVERPGTALELHTHWLFPVLAPDPDTLIRHLRRRGFDATCGASSLTAIQPAPERPDVRTPRAEAVMSRILFVPAYPEISVSQLRRLAEALAEGIDAAGIPLPVTAASRRASARERRVAGAGARRA